MKCVVMLIVAVSLIAQSALSFSVDGAKIVSSRTDIGPPKRKCVTTEFRITITRAEAIAALALPGGIPAATVTMQHWDEDPTTPDDQLAPSIDSSVDISQQVLAAAAMAPGGFNVQPYSREDCIDASTVGSNSGEEEIEWYVKVWVEWGTEWDGDQTPVKVVNL